MDVCLFEYPDGYEKPLNVVDCDVKVQFAKANIIFLFKHIDAILVNARLADDAISTERSSSSR